MTHSDLKKMRKDAVDIFHAGLKAVDPVAAVRRYVSLNHGQLIIADKTFDLSQVNNIFIVGAGKASGAMAAALEEILLDRITGGLVVVKYGHAVNLSHISLVEAGHPVPDKNGQEGAERIRKRIAKAGKKDLVICLMSGGGSALLPSPAPGLTLTDKQETIRYFCPAVPPSTKSTPSANILSRIKGGNWPCPLTRPGWFR